MARESFAEAVRDATRARRDDGATALRGAMTTADAGVMVAIIVVVTFARRVLASVRDRTNVRGHAAPSGPSRWGRVCA
jgi:hypothetical protein